VRHTEECKPVAIEPIIVGNFVTLSASILSGQNMGGSGRGLNEIYFPRGAMEDYKNLSEDRR
jgi:hypothetical protein